MKTGTPRDGISNITNIIFQQSSPDYTSADDSSSWSSSDSDTDSVLADFAKKEDESPQKKNERLDRKIAVLQAQIKYLEEQRVVVLKDKPTVQGTDKKDKGVGHKKDKPERPTIITNMNALFGTTVCQPSASGKQNSAGDQYQYAQGVDSSSNPFPNAAGQPHTSGYWQGAAYLNTFTSGSGNVINSVITNSYNNNSVRHVGPHGQQVHFKYTAATSHGGYPSGADYNQMFHRQGTYFDRATTYGVGTTVNNVIENVGNNNSLTVEHGIQKAKSKGSKDKHRHT